MPSTPSDRPAGAPAGSRVPAGRHPFRPHLTRLEDRVTPADITVSGATALIDLGVANEQLSFRTSSPGIITVNSTGGLTLNGSPVSPPLSLSGLTAVTVTDSAQGTGVLFDNSTAGYTATFSVTLDDAPGGVSFFGASAFGANDLTVTTARSVSVYGDVSATSGDVSLTANQQAAPTGGFFTGVEVFGSIVTAGDVTLVGRGGDDPDGVQYGVALLTGDGTFEVGQATGPFVSGKSVALVGTGGASTGGFSVGVIVSGFGTAVTAGAGGLTVVGTGGGADGGSGSPPGNDYGLFLATADVAATAGGNVHLVATAGFGTATALVLDMGVLVAADAGAAVTVVTDTLRFSDSPTVSAGTVTLRPLTPGRLVDLGGADASGSPALRVTAADLSDVQAPTLVIGGPDAGPERVTADLTFAAGTSLWLSSGGRIESLPAAGAVTAPGGGVTYLPGTGPGAGVAPARSGTDATAAAVSFAPGADLLIDVSPAVPGFQAAWLAASGTVHLTGADLVLTSGGGAIQPADEFAIVTGSAVVGTFNGLPNGAVVSLPAAPVPFRIFYTPGAVVLRANRPPVGVSAGGPYTVTVGQGVTLTAAGADPDGDPLAFTWDVNGDGVYGDEAGGGASNGGRTVTFTAAQLAALGVGLGTRPVGVRASDGFGGTAAARTTLRVVFAPAALVASDAGVVRVFAADGSTRDLVPFPGFLGDVAVASADLTGDGLPEVVVGAGAGGGPHVKVYDGATGGELASFFAYAPAFTGGVWVAASGDGRIVTGAGAFGGPHVKVFDPGGRELASFFAYIPTFTGGVRVAVGDVTGDGVADIVTGTGPGAAPHVRVFSGSTLAEVASFFALAPEFTGGVFVAAAGGRIAAGAGTWGGPQVQVFDPAGREQLSFFAYPTSFIGGVRVRFADLDGDGRTDLVTAPGLGGGLPVRALALPDLSVVRSFAPFDPLDPLGVFVG